MLNLVQGVVDQVEVLFQSPEKQTHTQSSLVCLQDSINLKVRCAKIILFSVPPKNTPKVEGEEQIIIN